MTSDIEAWKESLIEESKRHFVICTKYLTIINYLSSTFTNDDIHIVINYLKTNNGTTEDINNVKNWHQNSLLATQEHASRLQFLIADLQHAIRDINFNAGNDEFYLDELKPIKRHIYEYAIYIDTLLPAFKHKHVKQLYQRNIRALVKILDENLDMTNEVLDEKETWDKRLQMSRDRSSD